MSSRCPKRAESDRAGCASTWPSASTAAQQPSQSACGYKSMCCMHVQVFEQLFQLYEQRIPEKAERDLQRDRWIDPAKYEYSCPGNNWWTCPSSAPQTSPVCACSTTTSMATHMQALHSASSSCPWQWNLHVSPPFSHLAMLSLYGYAYAGFAFSFPFVSLAVGIFM